MSEINVQELLERIAKLEAAQEKPTNKTFDVSKPTIVPYSHQEYPKMLYHHKRREEKIVNSASEEHALLEAGFDKKPFTAENQLDESDRLMLLPKPQLLEMAKKEFDLDVSSSDKKEDIVLKIVEEKEKLGS